MEKNSKCNHCEDGSICEQIKKCYYPSDREILAAKASEIMAEAIRVSEKLPDREWIDVEYLGFNNADQVKVWHWSNGKILSEATCELNQPDASNVLDFMIELVRGFGQELAA